MVEMEMMILISIDLPCTSPVLPTKSESTIISLLHLVLLKFGRYRNYQIFIKYIIVGYTHDFVKNVSFEKT